MDKISCIQCVGECCSNICIEDIYGGTSLGVLVNVNGKHGFVL